MLPLNAYTQLKDLIGSVLHLSSDALHVHLGLLLFVTAVALLRSDRRYLQALCLLLLVSVLNECLDLAIDHRGGQGMRWLNSAKDIVNTVFWPVVWVAIGQRVTRALRTRTRPGPAPLQGVGK